MQLQELGETAAIRLLCEKLGTAPGLVVGPGDDAAVVREEGCAHDWVLTSDALIEGRHFTAETPAEAIGRKAVGRTLSDLASMGAEPAWSLINLVAPPSTDTEKVEAIYRGISAIAGHFGLTVAGGDLSSGPDLQLHVSAIGRCPPGQALTRAGGRAGDRLYVTGALGGSGTQGRHLDFEPRVREGIWLRGWATAAIDISDGLATDALHLAEASQTGLEIFADALPIHPHVSSAGEKAVDQALSDGEDFELLFCIPPEKASAFEAAWGEAFTTTCTGIGNLTDNPGEYRLVTIDGTSISLAPTGFDHFRDGTS